MSSQRKDVMTEAEGGVIWGHITRECRQPLETIKGKGTRFFPRASRRNHSSTDTLILGKILFQSSDLHKIKIINLSCFQTLRWW